MPGYDESDDPGLLIDQISAGGAAEKAGLKNGDIILKMDDHFVKDIDAYMKILPRYKPGDKLVVTIVRGDKSMKIPVTMGMSGR